MSERYKANKDNTLYFITLTVIKWIDLFTKPKNKHILIAGHTHKAMFSDFDVPPYFNDGCCVRKGELTAIEIEDEKITLIKWKQGNKGNGYERIVLGGPENISKYFKETC